MVSPVSSGQAVVPKAAPASTAPNTTFDQLVGGRRSPPNRQSPSLEGRVSQGYPIAEALFLTEEAKEAREWDDCGLEEGAKLSANRNADKQEALGCDFTEVFPVKTDEA